MDMKTLFEEFIASPNLHQPDKGFKSMMLAFGEYVRASDAQASTDSKGKAPLEDGQADIVAYVLRIKPVIILCDVGEPDPTPDRIQDWVKYEAKEGKLEVEIVTKV